MPKINLKEIKEIQQGCIKLIKIDSKYICVTKEYVSVSKKYIIIIIISSTPVFNIDNNKMISENQKMISEGSCDIKL